MKSGGGKTKGSTFERKICRDLSLWVSDGKRDDLYWRSAMSGGRATVRGKKGKDTNNQLGDITAVDPLGFPLTDRFVVECKHYKNLEWESFIYGKGFIWKTWDIVCDISYRNKRFPFLILKQNGRNAVVIVDHRTSGHLKDIGKIYPFLENPFMAFYFLENLTKFVESKLFLS
jgi:hypothetical protein